MKNMKRIIAVVMAIAMIFALSATALAALDTPYITKVQDSVISDSLWTKTVTVGTPQDVNFYAAIATDSIISDQYVTTWNYFPCTGTQEQADAFVQSKVSANVTAGSDKLASSLEIKAQFIETVSGVNYYAARITAKVSGTATAGMVRIRVTSTDTTNQDCTFTIVVESNSSTPSSVNNIKIEAHVIHGNTAHAVDNGPSNTGVTVYSANSSSSNKFYNDPSAAQTYATAGNTVDNLLADTSAGQITSGAIYSVTADYGYVSSIRMKTVFNMPADFTAHYDTTVSDYLGWMYGVLRTIDGTTYYVADSENISASIFELQSGDKVVWVYGTYTEMVNYFSQWPSI